MLRIVAEAGDQGSVEKLPRQEPSESGQQFSLVRFVQAFPRNRAESDKEAKPSARFPKRKSPCLALLSQLSNQSTINTTTVTSSSIGRFIFPLLATLALMYALLAGLRTVSDPDLFWQLTSGRWVVQHHHVFSTDVFSYTAHGQPWDLSLSVRECCSTLLT